MCLYTSLRLLLISQSRSLVARLVWWSGCGYFFIVFRSFWNLYRLNIIRIQDAYSQFWAPSEGTGWPWYFANYYPVKPLGIWKSRWAQQPSKDFLKACFALRLLLFFSYSLFSSASSFPVSFSFPTSLTFLLPLHTPLHHHSVVGLMG